MNDSQEKSPSYRDCLEDLLYDYVDLQRECHWTSKLNSILRLQETNECQKAYNDFTRKTIFIQNLIREDKWENPRNTPMYSSFSTLRNRAEKYWWQDS